MWTTSLKIQRLNDVQEGDLKGDISARYGHGHRATECFHAMLKQQLIDVSGLEGSDRALGYSLKTNYKPLNKLRLWPEKAQVN